MKSKVIKMLFMIMCIMCCLSIKSTAAAKEESDISEETYNRNIMNQMEAVLGNAKEDLPEMVNIEPLSEMMCLIDHANARIGPDTTYESLGKLEAGTAILVSGITENNWYQTSFLGKVAYVHGDYVTRIPVAEGLSQEMAEQIEEVVEEVEADVAADMEAMVLEENVKEIKFEEKNASNISNVMEKGSSNFTYAISCVLVVFSGSLLIVLMNRKKEQKENMKIADEEKKFDMSGFETISLDGEETDKLYCVGNEYGENIKDENK